MKGKEYKIDVSYNLQDDGVKLLHNYSVHTNISLKIHLALILSKLRIHNSPYLLSHWICDIHIHYVTNFDFQVIQTSICDSNTNFYQDTELA